MCERTIVTIVKSAVTVVIENHVVVVVVGRVFESTLHVLCRAEYREVVHCFGGQIAIEPRRFELLILEDWSNVVASLERVGIDVDVGIIINVESQVIDLGGN